MGDRASEQNVRSLNLDDYRVVMFATQGLVSGELTGPSEHVLVLTTPEIAGVFGMAC